MKGSIVLASATFLPLLQQAVSFQAKPQNVHFHKSWSLEAHRPLTTLHYRDEAEQDMDDESFEDLVQRAFTPSPSHESFHAPPPLHHSDHSDHHSVPSPDNHPNHPDRERNINDFLRATRKSFKNVESVVEDNLLARKPFLALCIFASTGLLVAYLMGIALLGGYMDSLNPAFNDVVPYWKEEVMTLTTPHADGSEQVELVPDIFIELDQISEHQAAAATTAESPMAVEE